MPASSRWFSTASFNAGTRNPFATDPMRAATLTGKGGNAAFLQDALAPLVGLLLRTREAA